LLNPPGSGHTGRSRWGQQQNQSHLATVGVELIAKFSRAGEIEEWRRRRGGALSLTRSRRAAGQGQDGERRATTCDWRSQTSQEAAHDPGFRGTWPGARPGHGALIAVIQMFLSNVVAPRGDWSQMSTPVPAGVPFDN
jgi:hypothetical protein